MITTLFLSFFWRFSSFSEDSFLGSPLQRTEEVVHVKMMFMLLNSYILIIPRAVAWKIDAPELVVIPHLFIYSIPLSEDLLLSYSSSFDDFIFLTYFQPSMIFFISRNSLFLSVARKSKYGHTSIMEICNICYYFAYNFSP